MKLNRDIRIVELLPIVLLFAGLLLFPVSMMNRDFSRIPGDKGDARFNNYILEHGYKYAKGEVPDYWDAPFLYPHRNTIALSDNLLGTLPVYIFFRSLKCDKETSFQWWFLSMFALNFLGCYLALRKWSGNVLLSSCGAYIYAFSIYLLGHINHVQILPKFIAPLVLFWLWQYLSKKRIVSLAFAVTGLTYQFYCGMYLGFFLFYVMLFMIISYLVIFRDTEIFKQFIQRKTALTIGGIIVVNLALLYPMLSHYIPVSGQLGFRSFNEISLYLPRWSSYFFSTPESYLWNNLSYHLRDSEVYWWENFLFCGILPWIAVLLLPVLWLHKEVKMETKKFLGFLVATFFLCVLFSIKFDGFTFYKLIVNMPGFGSMRSINRIINIIIIFQIVIFVFVFKGLQEKYKLAGKVMLFLPLMVVIDNSVTYWERTFSKVEVQNEVKAVADRIAAQQNPSYKAIAYQHKNFFGKETPSHLNVMLACQDLNIKCVNAYTGLFPPNFQGFADTEGIDSLYRWMNYNHSDTSGIQIITEFDFSFRHRQHGRLISSNDKVVLRDSTGGGRLYVGAEKDAVGEYWDIITKQDGKKIIRSQDDKFVCAELSSVGEIVSNRDAPGYWESFIFEDVKDGFIIIKAANEKYIGITSDQKLIANEVKERASLFKLEK